MIQTDETGQDVLLPEMIKSEVNFLVFPFFALSRKGLKNKTKTEYQEVIKRGDEKVEITWRVTANAEFGYPGPLDREVHKAVEQIISETLQQHGQVDNPVALGSLYNLCKRMGVKRGKAIYEQIRASLKRIRATSIESRGAFYSKASKRWVEDVFGLYDRVIFEGSELPTGEVADTNYVFLSSWYLKSLNAFYVKPIDYQYLKSLRSKVASRLYEVLGVRFYGLRGRKGQSHVWLDYQTLSQVLPITSQRYLSDAQAKLQSAHDELVETKFLSRVRWDRKSKTEWIIHYYPGERAEEEFRSKPKAIQETLELKAPEGPKEPQKVSKRHRARDRGSAGKKGASSGVSEWIPEQKELFSQLRERGVAHNQARHLIQERKEWIPRAIELWERKRDEDPEGMKNPAGYLIKIIEAGEDWQPPEEYVSSEERERTRKEEERRQQEKQAKEKEDRQKRDEHLSRILKAMEKLSEAEKEEVREEVLKRVEPFFRNHKDFDHIAQQDMASWQHRGMGVETRLCTLRNEVMEERFLSGKRSRRGS